jgi:hypothetical protein
MPLYRTVLKRETSLLQGAKNGAGKTNTTMFSIAILINLFEAELEKQS